MDLMFTVRVIPLAKGISKEELTYFSKTAIPEGTLVTVPLRNKERNALVISSEPVAEQKSQLRESSYALRRIKSVKNGTIFSKEFIAAAQKTAHYFASTLGVVLFQTTPAALLNSPVIVKEKEMGGNSGKTSAELLVLQTTSEDRFSHYKSIVRESFARQKSVLIIAPTLEQLEQLRKVLERGIENYTTILHSELPNAQITKQWRAIFNEEHPMLVIATPLFLSLPRSDWGTIILEGESGIGWKQQARPFIDTRILAEYLVQEQKGRLILGDTFLRVETLYRYFEGKLHELSPITNRLGGVQHTKLISMKETSGEKPGNFRLFSDEAKEMIEETVQKGEHMFIFAARRGLSPLTVCSDCSSTVLCTRCKAPTILHSLKSEGDLEQYFLCHKCGHIDPPEETCRVCGSWRLFLLGIGIERVERFLEKEFAAVPLYRFDSDSIKTHKKAHEIRDRFYNTRGSILLGTEMALRYLHSPVERTIAVSLDSLSAIPDWRSNEKIFGLLSRMRGFTKEHLLLQTRRSEGTFELALRGNALEFYREEIAARKDFSYPPFSVLIKLTLAGTPQALQKEEEKLLKYLEEFEPLPYPSLHEGEGKKYLNLLLKVPAHEWPQKLLRQKLVALPPYISVNVDPESLL